MTQLPSPKQSKIIYPDDNGEPMSNNTEQFRLIVWIKENLELLFADDPNVFVAGDLLWYPVEGNNELSQAPNVMVVIGIPKKYRASYQQWNENNITPQVTFEIWPGDSIGLLTKKFQLYQRYGVEEFYLYDWPNLELTGWQQVDGNFEKIPEIDGWVSPRLGVRFQVSEAELQIFGPIGEPFRSFVELDRLRRQAEMQAEQERLRAEQAETLLEQERSRLQALESRLRDMGIEIDRL